MNRPYDTITPTNPNLSTNTNFDLSVGWGDIYNRRAGLVSRRCEHLKTMQYGQSRTPVPTVKSVKNRFAVREKSCDDCRDRRPRLYVTINLKCSLRREADSLPYNRLHASPINPNLSTKNDYGNILHYQVRKKGRNMARK